MILRHTTMNAKKSVLCLIACLLGSQADAQDAPDEKTARQPSTEDRFEVRNLEGWTVYINRDVPRQYPEPTAKALEHLRWKLYQIKLATCGHTDLAATIADKTIANTIKNGISEHCDSVTGKALGVPDYCMSSTLVTMMLDGLAKRYRLKLRGRPQGKTANGGELPKE
jgi:hypothetical protein